MLLICGVVPAFLSFFIHLFIIPLGEEFCPADVLPFPDVSHPEFCPTDVPPSPDVSHLEFYPPTSHLLRMSHIQNYVRQCPTFSRCLTSEILSGRRPTFSGYLTFGILSGRHSTFSECLTSEILSRRHSTFSGCLTSGILSADIPPSPNVSHPEFCPPTSHLLRMSYIRNSVRPTSHLLRIHFRPQSSAPLDFNRYE